MNLKILLVFSSHCKSTLLQIPLGSLTLLPYLVVFNAVHTEKVGLLMRYTVNFMKGIFIRVGFWEVQDDKKRVVFIQKLIVVSTTHSTHNPLETSYCTNCQPTANAILVIC